MHRQATLLVATALFYTALAGCSNPLDNPAPVASDRSTPPDLDVCRDLDPEDLTAPTNDDVPVPCSRPHTAQTFATGSLPTSTGAAYDARGHGRFVFKRCSTAFRKYLGVDDSLALRIQLSWAWFRPSEKAWDGGARWYRCDVVGGAEDADRLRRLPADAKKLFSRGSLPDQWLTCAVGRTVTGSRKVPCSAPHDWRAVTAVKVGVPTEAYPGDKIVRARARDRCSDWVGAWLHYTPAYDYGYTWFHRAEWQTGIRRAVCWARTEQ